MNSWRITLTWPVIDHASSVFFLIAGEDKAKILKEVLTGPHDPERLPSQLIWPVSGILTLFLDRAALLFCPRLTGRVAVFWREKDDSGGRCRRY
jgi:6-phosphogluconolactonase